jgi:hypothetical protein
VREYMTERYLSGPGSSRIYWLVSRRGLAHEMFLILDGDESEFGKALPVFTAEGLAAAFLEASGLGGGAWRSRRVSVGELISLLCGPCGRVAGVALNPLGEALVAGAGLRADVGRVVFLDMLSGRGRAQKEARPLFASAPGPRALVGA